MNILILLGLGGLVGWTGSIYMNTANRLEFVMNVVLGIAGVTLGLLIFVGVKGTISINEGSLTLTAITGSLTSSGVVVAAVNLLRR